MNPAADIRSFRRALRHLERFTAATLKENSLCCGVTPNQCHVLLKVEEAGEITLSELTGYLGLDKSSLSRTVDGLVRQNLLERSEADHDRRFAAIRLSSRGKWYVEELNTACDHYYRPIYARLPTAIRNRIEEDFAALLRACRPEAPDTKAESPRACCSVDEILNKT